MNDILNFDSCSEDDEDSIDAQSAQFSAINYERYERVQNLVEDNEFPYYQEKLKSFEEHAKIDCSLFLDIFINGDKDVAAENK